MDVTRTEFSQNLTFLLLAKAFERLGHYALRAILVLYLVDNANGPGWQPDNALELYARFTFFIFVLPLLGGLLADFVLGSAKVLLLGALAMLLGYLMLVSAEASVIYPGVGLIALGSGCFGASHLAVIGQLCAGRADKLDSVMVLYSLLISLAAMLGGILVVIAIGDYSWMGGLFVVALAQLLSVASILFILQKLPAISRTKSIAADTCTWPKTHWGWLGGILLLGALSYFAGELQLEQGDTGSMLLANGPLIVTGLALPLAAILFWFRPSATMPKLALVAALYVLGWFCSQWLFDNAVFSGDDVGNQASVFAIGFIIVAGVVNALLYPLAMSAVLQKTNPKYIATSAAVAAMLFAV